MPEKFPSKATKTHHLTDEQRNFIDSVPADFTLSEYRAERAVNNTSGNNSIQEATTSRLLGADDSDFNASLIKRVGEPTISGMNVVESISKVPDIDLSTLELETYRDPVVRQPGVNDKLLYPDRPNTPAERAEARKMAAAAPKSGLFSTFKKIFG